MVIELKIEDVTVSADMDLTDGKEIFVEQTGDVDDALSETSENPVQNKVVTAALNGPTNRRAERERKNRK